jgi:hypothetical protein
VSLLNLVGWVVMGAVAAWVGRSFPLKTALLAWTALSGAMCAIGAFAIASQPIGTPTNFGRFGSLFVQWGFRAGQGRLIPAVLISWLFWVVAGAAVILMLSWRADRRQLLLALAWGVDALALLYVVGVILANKTPTSAATPSSLLVIVAALVGMIAVSLALWGMSGSPGAMRTALLIAGGPPLQIGGGYALFVLMMLTVGRNARWN